MTAAPAAPVRIALCGLGTVGRQVARLLLDHRRGVELVAAASKDPGQIGRRVHDVVGGGPPDGPAVTDAIGPLVAARPDAIVLSTGSFLEDVVDDVLACAAAGIDVVSPCEELAYPFSRAPEAARRIDEVARSGGATVLGTGVNPGFLFDELLAVASGVSWDVAAIRGRRVVDVSAFGEAIHARLGIGVTPEEFAAGRAAGTIAGHVGFPESIGMVCERLGVELDDPVQEEVEPLVEAGIVEGVVQRAAGTLDGAEFVRLELVLHQRPRDAGFEPVDQIEIDGAHPIRLTLTPGMDSVPATAAVLVNSLPGVLRAGPGLKTVKDLPAASAWIGDPRAPMLR